MCAPNITTHTVATAKRPRNSGALSSSTKPRAMVESRQSSTKRRRLEYDQERAKKKKKRSVRFAADDNSANTITTIPRRTPAERSLSWYTMADVAIFRYYESNDAAILRYLMSDVTTAKLLPQDASVYNGLERLLSPQIANEIRVRRALVVKCVLMEQQRFRSSNCDLSESQEVLRLADVSRVCTAKAAVLARAFGGPV
mmetsp:Transcript_233/g.550  ORF Transcript_233/g.550 Transcript_233/m.550 type:complete len:199 (+) Transcript_233:87-683(+)